MMQLKFFVFEVNMPVICEGVIEISQMSVDQSIAL